MSRAPEQTAGSAAPDGDRGGHLWPKDREVVAADGARIRYAVRGAPDRPWAVLCAGLLCPDSFWTYLAPVLARRYRVAMLNYRGVGASSGPRPPGLLGHDLRASDYTVERFAGDVVAVLDAEGVERAAVIGHSMGCQVALEVYRQVSAGRISALVLVTGPFRSPFDTFYGTGLAGSLFLPLYLALRALPTPLVRMLPKVARLPGVLDAAQRLRAIGPDTPREPMQPYLEHLARVDAGVALAAAKGMHTHDAGDLLAQVRVPTLVVAGGRDTFTPPHIARTMVDELPHAELLLLDEATHCALIEFPDEINRAVIAFLNRSFAAPSRDRPSLTERSGS